MRAVCFDFDGTLVDSEVFHAQNWHEFFASCGVDITPEAFLRDYAGVPWVKVADAVHQLFEIDHCPQTTVEKMEALTHEALLARGIPAKDGAAALLAELHGQVPLAVVTGAPRPYVEGILAKLGWLKYFDHVFCGEDVPMNKPAPDIYQLACRTLGFDTHQVVAVEDSHTGAQSALSAGLRVVVVNDTHVVGQDMTDYRYATLVDVQADQACWRVA
ncbi:HAD family hydrolase [Photobacterium aphoticum]|uniref:HAD family hydrolase n=1 Tax=Photobacterium aphoticum TaxID=754436 RepID=A0A0J1GRJ5_9GAMM|nr:HAD family phosphatase [Photobacterium aphoticum]KLV02353.1 HAD family hydrolase [Photobacterium aphoticum]PSU57284.1 HAD family phosphatase [Photobacterium aphoticum]GHA36643.1 phosphoglycolate phosphatase [Photobacterium aphoticum]